MHLECTAPLGPLGAHANACGALRRRPTCGRLASRKLASCAATPRCSGSGRCSLASLPARMATQHRAPSGCREAGNVPIWRARSVHKGTCEATRGEASHTIKKHAAGSGWPVLVPAPLLPPPLPPLPPPPPPPCGWPTPSHSATVIGL